MFNDKLNIGYKVGAQLREKTILDKWLTERYALFQDSNCNINAFEIHHLEWSIHQIELDSLTVNYPRFAILMNHPPDKAHYSNGVQVIAWDKKVTKQFSIK